MTLPTQVNTGVSPADRFIAASRNVVTRFD
jgi:hypothetical protein